MLSKVDNGIVHIWDLDQRLRVKVREEFLKTLLGKLYLKHDTGKEFCTMYGLDYKSFLNISKYHKPLRFLVRLCQILKISEPDLEKNIVSIRGPSGGFIIDEINFPLRFDTRYGARFIASLMTDGCLPKSRRIGYTNTRKELVLDFVESSEKIFGIFDHDVKRDKVDNTVFYQVDLPAVVGHILVSGLGFVTGNKLVSNFHIPQFFFNDEELIKEFLAYTIVNEGCVDYVKHTGCRRIRIGMGTFGDKLNFLEGCKKMLNTLGIECSLKFSQKKKAKISGHFTNIWTLEIGNRRNLENFHELIKLPLRYKQDKLDEIVTSYKQRGNGELYREIKELCFEHHEKNLDITVPIFRDKMKLTDETIRENMDKLESNGVVRRISGGNGPIPVKYKFNKLRKHRNVCELNGN